MNNIMGMVAVFIGIAIMLSVGITILSNASAGLDCSDITNSYGYKIGDALAKDAQGTGKPASAATADSSNLEKTGWYGLCLDAAAQAQSGYQLMVVALIVIAAVIILIVVRML